MSRIYVSSSWRNELQPSIVAALRAAGHQVYDFRHPEGRDDQNVWEVVTPGMQLEDKYRQGLLTGDDYDRLLRNEQVQERFEDHFMAMNDADTCILLLPCGSSSHVEAGYMAGAGKCVFVYDTGKHVKPELMYFTFNGYFHDWNDLLKALEAPVAGVCRVCGCTDTNPCYHPEHGNCFWVEPDLCSHCASIEQGGFGIEDDPATEHCINDMSTAFK